MLKRKAVQTSESCNVGLRMVCNRSHLNEKIRAIMTSTRLQIESACFQASNLFSLHKEQLNFNSAWHQKWSETQLQARLWWKKQESSAQSSR